MQKFNCYKMFSILVVTNLLSGAVCVEKNKINLVDIQKINPKIRLDLKYATNKNFTGEVIYDCAQMLFSP